MNISLYRAAADVQHKIALCADEDGVIDTDKLDLIEATFEQRAIATVAVYKAKGHTLETLQAYRAEIDAQIAKEQRNRERLHDYLKAAMMISGTGKVASDDGLLEARLYPQRDEFVEIDDGVNWPLELCSDPKPPGPSKTKIKAAINAGQPIANARIVRKDRLTIKE